MRNDTRQTLGVFAAGLAYWLAVSLLSGNREPWDAPSYWTLAYPLALALSALLGFVTRVRPWLIGILLIFAQLPVMLAVAGLGPLIVVGLLYLAALSLPAIILAWAGRMLRQRRLR